MMQFKKGSGPRDPNLAEPPNKADRPPPKRQGTIPDRQKAAAEREKNEIAAMAEQEKLRKKRSGRTARLREMRLAQEGLPAELAKPKDTETHLTDDHKFQVGEKVALAERPLDGSAVHECEVSRLLPADNSDRLDVRYRIREIDSGRERVVKESELADGSGTSGG
jgi:hypothetical protein